MNCPDSDFVDFIDKCIEWKVDMRLTPEQAFSHPFITKAVYELKGMRPDPPSSHHVDSGLPVIK
jgi:serine/threonine protein kinase